ncbi:1-acyl-sn-glycerol-3-phosphate acyltransferase [Lactobacillus sp. ESL0791]|uniref:1-acyl-sn-glycerol-3-phosphate acyltransferase n=1 Tax=Lactobacillus sp. ESL0791 TaxID=2983234 RepID=UPI0023F9F875|nr:1-acyl-sn-glycerol-3-phosphate acyltransferase [Lactobacillus sp. ESL0791]MDF7637895.1 1-acyl-sn-glycerol-3-phosphate acyltransferase [Lactobacillus sp. ESL0791]
MTKKSYYYHKLTDDVVNSKNQDLHLPDNYEILPHSLGAKIWSTSMRPVAHAFALLYAKILHVQVVGKDKISLVNDQGYFVYGNHTQPVGDAFLPLIIFPSKNYYVLASQANWGIPIIGKYILPYAGLPVGDDMVQMGKLLSAIKNVILTKKGIIAIYPEAHVWPCYTKIRPFPATSMHFPVALNRPSFAMTTTYQRPNRGTKPWITIYLDGPFYPDKNLPKKAAQNKLHDQISQTLNNRSRLSNYQYYNYQKIN